MYQKPEKVDFGAVCVLFFAVPRVRLLIDMTILGSEEFRIHGLGMDVLFLWFVRYGCGSKPGYLANTTCGRSPRAPHASFGVLYPGFEEGERK